MVASRKGNNTPHPVVGEKVGLRLGGTPSAWTARAGFYVRPPSYFLKHGSGQTIFDTGF